MKSKSFLLSGVSAFSPMTGAPMPVKLPVRTDPEAVKAIAASWTDKTPAQITQDILAITEAVANGDAATIQRLLPHAGPTR